MLDGRIMDLTGAQKFTPESTAIAQVGKRRRSRAMARMSRLLDGLLIALAIVTRDCGRPGLQSHLVPRSTYEHGEIAANLLAGRGLRSSSWVLMGRPRSRRRLSGTGRVGLRDRRRRDSAIIALAGARPIRPRRSARPGRFAPVPVDRARTALAGLDRRLIVALHPTLVYAATHVQVATLGATLLIWTLAWAYQTGASGRTRDAAITGGLLALLALTDPILALAMAGVAWAICQHSS